MLPPTDPPCPPRPFTGFERERATYARLKADLLAHHPDMFVVIVGDEALGLFGTHVEAIRAGWQYFGPGSLYVKHILADEPVAMVSRDVKP